MLARLPTVVLCLLAGVASQYQDELAEDEQAMQPLGQASRTHPVQSAGANAARATGRVQPSVLPSGRASATGLDSLPKSSSASAAASDTPASAQQREFEREMAFKASTGSISHDLTDSISSNSALETGSRSSNSVLGLEHSSFDSAVGTAADRGSAARQSWNTLASQNEAGAAGVMSSSTAGQTGSSSRQQSLGDGESEADIGDYDPRGNFGINGGTASSKAGGSGGAGADSRGFATGSSTGGLAASSRQGVTGDVIQDGRSFGLGTSTTGTTGTVTYCYK